MSSGFTPVREYIAEAIADDSQYQTFAWPPATPLANSVVIAPGSPWIESLSIAKGVMTNWTISIYVNAADNRNDLVTLENMVATVLLNLPDGIIFSEVSQPNVIDLPNTMLTSCEITVSATASLEE